MLDFDSIIVLLSLLTALACISLFIAFIYIHRKRNAILIDSLRDYKNKAERGYKKTTNQTDKEIYLAYKNAFNEAIKLAQKGML